MTDISGVVDTLTIGMYEINYSKTDSSDHLTSLTRTVNVVPRQITISADNKSKELNDIDPLFTYEITSGSLYSDDVITGELSRPTGELAGLYQINQGTLALNDNYELTFLPGVLTIIGADEEPVAPTDTNPTVKPTAGSALSITSIVPIFTNPQLKPSTTDVLGTQTIKEQPKYTTDDNTDNTPTPPVTRKTNPLDFTFWGIHLWVWLLIIAIGDFLYTIGSSRRK